MMRIGTRKMLNICAMGIFVCSIFKTISYNDLHKKRKKIEVNKPRNSVVPRPFNQENRLFQI